MPRVRSRRRLSATDPLAGVPLTAELRARLSPGDYPAIAAAIVDAERARPDSLAALLCKIALARAESDPSGALAKLARARTFRASTPIGGYRPGPAATYLDHSEAIHD
jgi:hypothetical protein